LGVLIPLSASGTHVQTPTDVEVFNCIRSIQIRYAQLEKENFTEAKRQFRAMIRETARGLNVAELTPYQTILIGPLLQSGLPQGDLKDALNEALDRTTTDPEHGAAALLLLHSLNYWDDLERTYLDRFFQHPHMVATMNGWFGPRAINAFGLAPREMIRFGPHIERAILSINPNSVSNSPGRSSVARLFEALDHPDIAAETRTRRRRIHDHLLKIARSRLSKLAPNGGGSYQPQELQFIGGVDLVEYLEGPASRSELTGRQAPEMAFLWQRGPDAPFSKLLDLRGKVVVLDFWATWCGPCVATFPDLRELQTHYADDDVVIIGVTSIQGYHVPVGQGAMILKDDPDRELALMEDYITRNDINWNIAFSTRSVIEPRFDVRGIPHLTIIDAQGHVRYNGLHPGGSSFEEKTKMIDALLEESE